MDLEEWQDGNALVFKVMDRRLDAISAPAVRTRLRKLIRDGHRRIAFDLSRVEFIDSSGLSALVYAMKQLGASGDMVVGGARSTVISLFKLTRLDKVFRVFPDTEEAIAALR